jgi:homoserine O-succinyltransferase
MPDAACEATERQFLDLLRAAAGTTIVRLKLFAIADVPRADETRRALAARYRDLTELLDTPLDGLIVTGTEPRAPNLSDEPYWAALSRLIDWSRQFDNLVLSRRARGGAARRRHRPPAARGQIVRCVRV